MKNSPISSHILRLSKQLIAIPSTLDNPVANWAVLEVAKKELEGYFPIEEFESNGSPSLLIHNTNRRTRHFKIILNAHLDVLAGTPEQFFQVVKGNKLYGRGTADMKSAASVMILLFKRIAEKVNYPLALQLVTDEEEGGYNGTKYQVEKGVTADFVIAGERTELKINNRAKGIINLKLHATGKAAHGAYPWMGENALVNLQTAIDQILKLYPTPDKPQWSTTVNVAKIETPNIAYNKVPDIATALLDIRYVSASDKAILRKIKSVLSKHIKMEVTATSGSQFTQEDNLYIEILKTHIQAQIKKQPEVVAHYGGSDIRFFEEKGIPGICFGPRGANSHADNEWVDVKSLGTYYQILENFLLSLNS